jgi:toxin-antitoxin system PIN domain toxin
VIVVDANLLLYAYDSVSPKYRQAKDWLVRTLSADYPVGIPLQSIGAFLRVATDPRLPGERFTMEEAVRIIESWLEPPSVSLLSPGDQHWPHLRLMLIKGQVRGPLVSDAQLAALTMEVGGELYSTDRDFARFPGLRWKNPLEDTTPQR